MSNIILANAPNAPPIKVHTSARRWLFTTANVAQRALAIVHTITRL